MRINKLSSFTACSVLTGEEDSDGGAGKQDIKFVEVTDKVHGRGEGLHTGDALYGYSLWGRNWRTCAMMTC